RAHHHRRQRLLLLPHHQARRLSLAQLGQQLAAGAYPCLGLRPCLLPAADHPAVFRGRSPDPDLPHRADHPRPRRHRPADRETGHERRRAAGQHRLSLRHRAARAPLDHVRKPAGGELMKIVDARANRPQYLPETASQTAGPYVHIGLAPGAAGFRIFDRELGWDIAGPNAAGERIRVEGLVIDGTGSPVKDVLIEVWQANAAGIYAHPEGGGAVEDGFRGWGRVITDVGTGERAFDTVKPGPVRARGRMASGVAQRVRDSHPDWQGRAQEDNVPMAPHLNLWIVARGINIGLNTRMYFDDETEA